MGDPTRGVYEKFIVRRTDGKHRPGQKHDGCVYFVLDLDHDKHAIPALEAYAASCRAEYPDLARDIDEMADAALLSRNEPARLTAGDVLRDQMHASKPLDPAGGKESE